MLPPRQKWPNHSVLAIDAKSFYASVELSDRSLDPLKTKLAVVSDLSKRGSVVLAASPELKLQHNIKTGSRLFQIPNREDIILAQSRMGRYVDVSMGIMDILYKYAPSEAIHAYSIDEWIITIDGTEHMHGSHKQVAMKIKHDIYKVFGIPVSIGWGQNKVVAKITMDLIGKKSGYAECSYDQIETLLWPHSVRDVWGIGGRYARRLNAMGIYTLGQLAQKPLHVLRQEFGPAMGEQFYYHANGLDFSPVFVDPIMEARKGFSNGITFMTDYSWEDTKVVIHELSDLLAARLRSYHMAAFTVNLSMRYTNDYNGRRFSQSITLSSATNLSIHLFEACMTMNSKNEIPAPIRQISMSVTNVIHESEIQLDLFSWEEDEKQRALESALDKIVAKFGTTGIFRATSLTKAGTLQDRAKKIGGHYE
ncbi:DNA polymerase V [Paenibacillus sp. NPDC056933]|uniref:Y-family DNA polymerase n=1 Tax=Paenibacillus sp. NPDC056933 TaxID=3345968 RepID=UPI003624F647